jgi:hypothetical protein
MNEDIRKLLDSMTPEERLQIVKYVEAKDDLLCVSFQRDRFDSGLVKKGCCECPEDGWQTFKAFLEDFCHSEEVFTSLVESFMDSELGARRPG